MMDVLGPIERANLNHKTCRPTTEQEEWNHQHQHHHQNIHDPLILERVYIRLGKTGGQLQTGSKTGPGGLQGLRSSGSHII
jgi:hypothetical protein